MHSASDQRLGQISTRLAAIAGRRFYFHLGFPPARPGKPNSAASGSEAVVIDRSLGCVGRSHACATNRADRRDPGTRSHEPEYNSLRPVFYYVVRCMPGHMTEQERLNKNAICDRLAGEGIDGRSDDEAIARTLSLTALAVELERPDSLSRALAWHDLLEKRTITGQQAIALDLSRANAIAGRRYGTAWTWDQPTLAREIFYLRRALSHPEFLRTAVITKCKCLNNLGNRLRVSGRVLEALELWGRALEVQPNFGMALCNRAVGLVNYGTVLEDPDERILFLWIAHQEATAALAPTALYTDQTDQRTRESVSDLKQWIEAQFDVAAVTALNPLASQDICATDSERNYRQWCLDNRLFLNPLNDLGPYTIASTDSLALPQHVVRVDAPHRFDSFFYQMKQEYVAARWLVYDGLTSKIPHFSDRHVLIGATEPRPSVSLAIEELKAAYRAAYSLFDKIAYFLAAYMRLGIAENQITFRTLWRAGERKPLRNQFDLTGNWGFCALYWLAKDFLEKENDEVAEPQARGLSDIRNHVEHKYFRVTITEPAEPAPGDLALMVSREQFQRKTLHLLKLARSALIYLSIGVGFEERRREPSRVDESVEDLPSTPFLADDDKI